MYRKIPFYDIEDREELLNGVLNGCRLSFERMVLGHTKLAMRIASGEAHAQNVRHLEDELVGAAFEAIVHAVCRIQGGHLTHDNYTGYIIFFIRSFIKKMIRKSKSTSADGMVIPDRSTCLKNFKEVLFSIAKTRTERRIMDLRIKGFTDVEISEILDIPRTTVFRTRKELKRRYERKVSR